MQYIKLDHTHREAIKPLFGIQRFMGMKDPDNHFNTEQFEGNFNEIIYDNFCNTYMSDLITYHVFGAINDDGQIEGFIAFHQSVMEPCWYGTMIRKTRDSNVQKTLLDKVIEYNEQCGRLKFYTLWNAKHTKPLRRFAYSSYNNERYDYFDELIIPKHHKCFYTTYWEHLYIRSMLPTDTVVRCSFLKQKYRDKLPVGGNI